MDATADRQRGGQRQGFFYSLIAELVEAVRITMRYDVPRQYSASGTRETRRQWYARLGRDAPKPSVPPAAQHIYGLFWSLSSQRQPGAPIGPTAINAWAQLSATPIDPFVAEAIIAMDDAFLSVYCDERDAARERETGRG